RSGGGREPQQQVPLAPEVRQRREYIHRTEGARSYPARGEITGAAERLSGYRAGAGRLESLRECRRRDAGKRITASAGCESGIAGGYSEGGGTGRRDNGGHALQQHGRADGAGSAL